MSGMIWDDNGNRKGRMDLRTLSQKKKKKNIPEHDNQQTVDWYPASAVARAQGASRENLFQSC